MKNIKNLVACFLMITPLLFSVSCGLKTTDISGYYTSQYLNNVYYFSPDGKIYINDSYESYSCYEVKDGKIYTYIEGEEDSKLAFDFEKTEDGFMWGDIKYTRLSDYDEFMEK